MTAFGLTAAGFRRKRFRDIIIEKEARARELFGEDVNLSESSPIGLFIRVNAWEEAIVWQMAEDVYLSAFLNSATGSSLDRVVQYIGISRRQATRATGEVTFTGTNGTIIPEGFLVAADGVRFSTDAEVEVVAGSITIGASAVAAGSNGNVQAGVISTIVNPIAGLTAVTNAEPFTGGTEIETDSQLRDRYIRSVAIGGASTVDSIRASLVNTVGVIDALVIPNFLDVPDGEGRPPKSFESYVYGGEAGDIARTIFNSAAAGIQPYGTETEIVEDSSGQPHSIGFTYVAEVDIEVNIDPTTNAYFPADGEEQIVSAIVEYIGGLDEDGQMYSGLSMGQDVVFTRILKAALSIEGVTDVDAQIGIVGGGSMAAANIPIDITEIARVSYDNIHIGPWG